MCFASTAALIHHLFSSSLALVYLDTSISQTVKHICFLAAAVKRVHFWARTDLCIPHIANNNFRTRKTKLPSHAVPPYKDAQGKDHRLSSLYTVNISTTLHVSSGGWVGGKKNKITNTCLFEMCLSTHTAVHWHSYELKSHTGSLVQLPQVIQF